MKLAGVCCNAGEEIWVSVEVGPKNNFLNLKTQRKKGQRDEKAFFY